MRKFLVKSALVLAGGYALLFFCLIGIGDAETRVWFLDVGQGDAILVRAAGGETILIDGGPDDAVLRELSAVLPFYERSIDLVVLTHPHADHINGLVEVLKRYNVGRVMMTGVANGDAAYMEFLDILNDKRIPVSYARSAVDYRLGAVKMDIVFPIEPMEGEKVENLNNSSIAMRLITHGGVYFLSGDLELEGEENILASEQDVSADVFKAGHHGSRTASSLALLEAVAAKTAVITCGIDNRFNHPHAETVTNFLNLGMRIYRTDVDGRVTLGAI